MKLHAGASMGPSATSRDRIWRRGLAACVAAALLAVLSLAPHFTSSTELVRMRNALILDPALGADFDWTPPASPAGFLVETAPAAPLFAQAVQQLGLAAMPDDWARGLAISRALLGSAPVLTGGAIQSDLQTTYLRITQHGEGYCADFVRVFHALAHAAGMTTRSWAFSFDGFGGHGHVWVELWNRQQQRWQLMDVFDNLYFTDGDAKPLSAAQLRQALLAGSTTLAIVPLYSGARPGFEIQSKAWDYFRRGSDQWYLWWGNNVQSYDESLLVRSLGRVSRSLEQFGGILQGVQPHIRILPTASNMPLLQEMVLLRVQLLWVGAIIAASMLSAMALTIWRRAATSPSA